MIKLLIVDDDKMTRRISQNRLIKMGYHVIAEKGGHEAIMRIETEAVDVVLLDQMMPEMDGLDTYERIHEISPSLPVIMATFHGSTNLAVVFMKQGGADFIQKPLDFEVLDLKIRKILNNLKIEQKIRDTEIEKIAFQEAEHMKQVISASLSHELRTPLNFIRGIVNPLKQALVKGEITLPLFSSRMEDMRHAWAMLNDGINDLIEIALIEKGESLLLTDVAVSELISELMREAQNRAFSKGFTEIKAEVEPTLPLLRTDRKKLRRILWSILDNAVRYTESGVIFIKATHENGQVIISVKDSGPGVPETIAPSIFDRFADESFHGEKEIAGAGLYLSKKLIGLLKGEIWFESGAGQGATFFVSLPFAIDSV